MSSPDEARPSSILGYAERRKEVEILEIVAQHLKDKRAELRKNLESVLDASPTEQQWWDGDMLKLNHATERLPNGRIPLELWLENAIDLINNDPRLTDSDKKTKVDKLKDGQNAVLRKYPRLPMPPVADDSPGTQAQDRAGLQEAARNSHRGGSTNATATSAAWIDLIIECSGDEVRVGARGSRGQNVSSRSLGVTREALDSFSKRVERAAAYRQRLPNEVITQAQAIQKAVLAEEIGTVFTRMRDAAGGALLVRFMVPRELQSVPWEALCNQGEALGFLGTAPDVLPVRGVASTEAWTPREVSGAVKVLAVAPTGGAGLVNLRLALQERISSGEIEWIDPIEGAAASKRGLFDQLRDRPLPHVLHFLGHGGFENGLPALRMADEDGEEQWLHVELLAQQLKANFSQSLRLIVLEACEGAKPSAFASAAESLANAKADAVVAHLWPVRADVARTCSTNLYRALASANQYVAGDVAFAANEARRAMLSIHDSSAEAMSPVLYLRAPTGRLFDFTGRYTQPLAVTNPLPNPTMGQPLEHKRPIPGNEAAAIRMNTTPPLDLIDVLADLYPDVPEARALWVRAGGKASDIENIPRPRDLWQHIWTQSVNGARVRPISILKAAQADFSHNPVLARYISLME